jgi:hypothetical protein
MLELAGINLWAVLVVWILYMAVGAFWYSTQGFAKQWTKHTGVDILKIPTDQATRILIFVALASLVQTLTLALLLNSLGVSTVTEGLIAGLVMWFGLTTATTVGVTLYTRRSWKFLWLNSAYFLVVMALGSVILAIWR